MTTTQHYDTLRFDKIKDLKRLRNSLNGNPRYQVTLSLADGTEWIRRTESDSMVGFVINNSEYRDTPVWVTFNGRGNIIDVTRGHNA